MDIDESCECCSVIRITWRQKYFENQEDRELKKYRNFLNKPLIFIYWMKNSNKKNLFLFSSEAFWIKMRVCRDFIEQISIKMFFFKSRLT